MKSCALILGMLILFPVIGLSSCAYDKDMAYLNDQVIVLNRRVAKLEEGMDSKLSTIRSSSADTRVEMDQMRGEVQKLQSRVEDNERLIKRSVERDLGDTDTAKRAMGDVSRRLNDLEAAVKAQQSYLGLESSQSGSPGVAPVEPKAQVAAVPPPAPAKPKDVELYDNSLALYQDKKYEDAIIGFKDFLKKYPKSNRADSALFWVGESYYNLKQYEQAILAYNDVIKNYPKGNKVPNALLRQALAFIEINDKVSAKLLLKKLVKEHPNTGEAKIATKKLETLK